MTFLPVVAWPVVLVLALAALAAVWWKPSDDGPEESRGRHWRLSSAVVLLAVAAMRPALPGDQVEATAANLNVYFVVDTTSSIIAEDYGRGEPRLDGVATDIAQIATSLAGARYTVITFDHQARVRLPLTTDTTALEAALVTLLPEASEYSRGTSVTEARERLATLLAQADARHPERGRVVYYFGDGEHTAAEAPQPFALPRGLVDGGAVLGYGTAEGGRMKSTRSRFDVDGGYMQDPTTGADARSVIDEPMLRGIAEQLGLPYVHRSAGDPITPVTESLDMSQFGTSTEIEARKVRARQELHWALLLGLALVAAWEVGAGTAALSHSRRRRPS